MIEHLFSLTEIFARLMSKSMRPLSGFFARLRKKRGQILWTIVTDGFRFSEEPVAYAFFMKSGDASKLRNVKVAGNGKKLEIDFHRDGRGTWLRYGMHVRREGGAFCPALDPWIYD